MDAPPSGTFGDVLRRYRAAAGLTQEELAERARLSPRAISDLERGVRNRPWRETIQLLADALQLDSSGRAQLEAAARRSSLRSSIGILTDSARLDARMPRTNLPVALTSFVGREREVQNLRGLLAATRLLTLTGSAGCGKTRLAGELGRAMLDDFADGVWFVDLAPLADPTFVAAGVATVLQVREFPGRPLLATLGEALRPRRLLLLLDNCEHLIAACAELADALLRSCPRLGILATSRERLSVPGEVVFRVPSLALPDSTGRQSPEDLLANESVQLIVDRARAVLPHFAVTAANAPALARVCQRLDGIPLAIELAAARVPVLTVEQIATRLDDRFRLLTGGSRTASRRQQTLRATIDWSHDLLSDPERIMFRRLAVFAGGWTLDAAEAVCADVGDVLDLLTRLVEKSLVQVDERGEQARYRFLETIRAYAADRLGESGEEGDLRRRHAACFLALAELNKAQWYLPRRYEWLTWVEQERDNVRAALRWLVEQGDPTRALRLAACLGPFWMIRGPVSEGRAQLSEVLALSEAPTVDGESRGPDRLWRARALHWLAGLARRQSDYAAARSLYGESLALLRELGNRQGIASSLVQAGNVEFLRGDDAAAHPLLEEGLAIARASHDRQGVAYALRHLGSVAVHRADDALARSLLEEALTAAGEVEDRFIRSYIQQSLGHVALAQGSFAEARALFWEAQAIARDFDDRQMIAHTLEGLAGLAAARGQPARALRLAGAADTVRTTIGVALPPTWRDVLERELRPARRAAREAAAWAEGQAMTLEQAIAYALEEDGA